MACVSLGRRVLTPPIHEGRHQSETLLDGLDVEDIERSRALGRLWFSWLWRVLETQLAARRSCMLEGNFSAPVADEFNALASRYA